MKGTIDLLLDLDLLNIRLYYDLKTGEIILVVCSINRLCNPCQVVEMIIGRVCEPIFISPLLM